MRLEPVNCNHGEHTSKDYRRYSRETQARQIKSGTEAIDALTQANADAHGKSQESRSMSRLQAMQVSNEDKLDQMRKYG